jgi:hypothetical protein
MKELPRHGGQVEFGVRLRTNPPQIVDIPPLEVGASGERCEFVAVSGLEGGRGHRVGNS